MLEHLVQYGVYRGKDRFSESGQMYRVYRLVALHLLDENYPLPHFSSHIHPFGLQFFRELLVQGADLVAEHSGIAGAISPPGDEMYYIRSLISLVIFKIKLDNVVDHRHQLVEGTAIGAERAAGGLGAGAEVAVLIPRHIKNEFSQFSSRIFCPIINRWPCQA